MEQTGLHQEFTPLPSPRWLRPFRVAWLLLALLVTAVVLPGLAAYHAYLVTFYTDSFQDIGLDPGRYAGYVVVLDTVVILAHLLLAGLIVRRRPHEGMALLTAVTLTANSAVIPIAGFVRTLNNEPLFQAASYLVLYLGLVTSVWMLYLFPDGRFVPRWTRITAMMWALLILPPLTLPGSVLDMSQWPWPLQAGLLLFWCGVGVWAQLDRYEHVADPVQKQQMKWAALGLLVAAAAPFTYYFLLFVSPAVDVPQVPNLFQQRLGTELFTALVTLRFVGLTAVRLLSLLFPLSFAIAILRYRLWDIDLLINRTLVYSLLSAFIIGAYVLLVGLAGVLFPLQNNFLLTIAATGLIAILFQPLRARLQARVNLWIYGKPEDPMTALAKLGEQLEATAVPAQTLPTLLETIAQSLPSPYTAIAMPTMAQIITSVGQPTAVPPHPFPLFHQATTIGWLLVAPATAEGRFSPDQEQLLQHVARQVGTAVHILKLTTDLQQANDQLWQTEQAERLRLRRDLHDGLGPALAGLALKLDAARNYAAQNPAAADQLLQEYKTQTGEIIRDIRRIVHDLRPSALDQLGLLSALQEFVAQNSNGLPAAASGRTHLSLIAPAEIPALPAATEVAVYRIATEAITNSQRHAQAKQCTVQVAVDDRLTLEIHDDGVGLPAGYQPGVGLSSMRERAEELGGSFTIVSDAGGTAVTAVLPLSNS
ncbi:MAG: sensor histidine kinase [Anaerolineae bacterium]|nr:sensor histidine kinase [Anaerolineae bacterium]